MYAWLNFKRGTTPSFCTHSVRSVSQIISCFLHQLNGKNPSRYLRGSCPLKGTALRAGPPFSWGVTSDQRGPARRAVKKGIKRPPRALAAERAESPRIGLPGHPPGGRVTGVWLASFKKTSAVHGGVGKSTTSVGLRAPAGRFDAAKGGSIDTGDGRSVVNFPTCWSYPSSD